MKNAITFFSSVGVLTSDDELSRNNKRFVVYEAILMSLGGILWGTICLFLDRIPQSIIPFSYVLMSIINIALFSRTKNFQVAQFFQTAISLLLPFTFQWHLGGFANSGAVMLWALLALAASLSYSSLKVGFFWLSAYVMLTVFSLYSDTYFAALYPFELSQSACSILLTINIIAVSMAIFVLVQYFVQINASAYKKINETNTVLSRSEKMAALGQLSANVAHEINTPLGAIKAIGEINEDQLLNSISTLGELNLTSSKDEIAVLIEFLKAHEIRNLKLSYEETQKLRENLSNSSKRLGIDLSSSEVKALIEVEIFEIPDFLKKLEKEKLGLTIDFIYNSLLPVKLNKTTLHAINNASMVVNSMKKFLKEAKSSIESTEKINLENSVQSVFQIFQVQLFHDIEITIDIPSNIEIFANPNQLTQIWTNLIMNACQAMNFNGKLNISASKRDEMIKIEIKDSGHGVPDDLKDEIYKPFFTTKGNSGSGIGLGIVKEIVESLKGKLTHESNEWGGATFVILLKLD